MKPHAWGIEEVDGGPVGTDYFWICKVCGASGGPQDWYPQGPKKAWLAGFSLPLDVTDCDAAAKVANRARAARKAKRAREAQKARQAHADKRRAAR